jgi:hypothetical protein
VKRSWKYWVILVSLILMLSGCGGSPAPTVTKTVEVPEPTVTKTVEVPGPTITKTVEVPGPTVTKTVEVSTPKLSPTQPGQKTATPNQTNTIITITASDLYSEYKANQFSADTKYKGKVIRVSGIITDLGETWSSTTWSHLPSVRLYDFFGVCCMFEDKDRQLLAQLTKGNTASIEGTCIGWGSISSVVNLENCAIIQ